MKTDDKLFRSLFTSYDIFATFEPNYRALAMMEFNSVRNCMIGLYNSTVNNGALKLYANNVSDENTQLFRESSFVYNLTREQCFGTWEIASNNVTLLSGVCNNSPQEVSQDFIGQGYYNIDVLPVLIHVVGADNGGRMNSGWRLPSFATSVASAWWSRQAFMLPGVDNKQRSNAFYPSHNETLSSTNSALHAAWPLFFVLITHPMLRLFATVVMLSFYEVPVSRGFGLISILAGIDAPSLAILDGAALSGRLADPVSLMFRAESHASSDNNEMETEAVPSLLRYRLSRSKVSKSTSEMKREHVYR